MIEKLKSINPAVESFFKVALDDMMASDIMSYKHPLYQNCLMIPMKKILYKFDRQKLILQSNLKYEVKLTDGKTNKLLVLLILNVLEIHKEENEYIQDEIYKFVTGIFSNKQDQVLSSVLLQEDMQILLLIDNRISTDNGKKIVNNV